MRILLYILIFISISFDYLWFFNVPLWLLLLILLTLGFLINKNWQNNLSFTLRNLNKIIVPYFIFTTYIGIRNIVDYDIDNFIQLFILNLMTLWLFVIIISSLLTEDRQNILNIVYFFVLFQFVLGFSQLVGNNFFWSLPDKIWEFSHSTPSKLAEKGLSSFSDTGRLRGSQVFTHKFNPIIGITFSILLGMFIYNKKSIKNNSFHKVSMLLSGFLLLFTFSRSVWISITIAFVMMLLFSNKKKKSIQLLFLPSLIFVIGAFTLDSKGFEQAYRLLTYGYNSGSDSARLISMQVGLENFFESPIFGTGINFVNDFWVGVHSVPIYFLGAYGATAFLLFIVFWFNLFRFAIRKIKINDYAKILSFVLIIIFIDNLTHTSGLLKVDIAQPALLGIALSLFLKSDSMEQKN